MPATINGIGVFLPEKILTNAELEKMVDTTDEWITTRTGIKERRILEASTNMTATDMGAIAVKRALENAGIGIGEVDGIIAAGLNPEKRFPAMACLLQQKIGAKGFAFDVTAACAGFVFAVNMASLLIDSGQCKTVVVVGCEHISPVVDWEDRGTCILFGDAAGAVVLQKSEDPNRGVLNSELESDGNSSDILYLDSEKPANEKSPCIVMNGKRVFRLATTTLVEVVEKSLSKAGYNTKDLDLAVFHQANVRILSTVAEKLGLEPNQYIVNVNKYGNTSSASIPLALWEAQEKGLLAPGKLVALAAIGGGMSWGCNLVRW